MYPDRMPPSTSYDAARFDRERQKMLRRGWSWKKRAAHFVGRAGWRATKATTRTTIKHRSWLWPIIGSSGMFAAAAFLGYTVDGWKTALVLCVLAGLVLGWNQYRAWQAAEAWLQRSLIVSWIVWAASTAWTTVAAGAGTFSAPVLGGMAHMTLPGAMAAPLPGLLLLATIGAEAWWVIHQHQRKTQQIVQQVEDEAPEKAIDRRVQTWMELIAKKDGGALPGANLVGVHDLCDENGTPNGLGWGAFVRLPVDDAQTSDNVIANTRRIAKAFGVPATQVVVEPSIDGLEDNARLLVLTSNPLEQVQTFEGPKLNHTTGEVPIGVHADGTHAMWRLWTPGSGACHGLIAGTTGAGKGGLINVLCTEIRHSGFAALLFGDPQGGESAPDWAEGAHCFAGSIPRIRRMLQGVEREMKRREKRRARERWVDEKGRTRRGRGKYDPSSDEPLLTVVIDEAWQVTPDPECRRIIALIGKQGRKLGVGIILVVQVPSLAELGGDLTIRSMLSSTNIVILRTADKLSAQMGVPMDLPVDPVNLPAQWQDGSTTAGLGYLCRAGGRVSPMRGMFVEDAYDYATTGHPVVLPPETTASWADEQGNYYLDWERLLDVDDDEESAAVWADVSGYTVEIPQGTNERIVAFLAQRLARGETAVRSGVIASKLGLTGPQTSNALKRMAAKEPALVQNIGHGRWGLTDTAEVNGELVGAAS